MLRAIGIKKNILALSKETKLKGMSFYIKGESQLIRSRGKCKHSGVVFPVSEADFNNLSGQIRGAIKYLKKNHAELSSLASKGFKDMQLDFGIDKRDVGAQFDCFPPELLRLAGQMEIGIELSQYLIEDEEPTKGKGKKR